MVSCILMFSLDENPTAVNLCVCVCVQVVKLDPVIEDDEELQRSSKVRDILRKQFDVWIILIISHLTQLCLWLQLLPVHTLRLGVELDSFDGHHYISSVVPGGPVEQHGVLRPEDELLEVVSQ